MISLMRRYRRGLQIGLLVVIAAFVASLFVFGSSGFDKGGGERTWALVETFETLVRPWNIDGTSVRPFHRMVAHTGFITVARRVVPEEGGAARGQRLPPPERDE